MLVQPALKDGPNNVTIGATAHSLERDKILKVTSNPISEAHKNACFVISKQILIHHLCTTQFKSPLELHWAEESVFLLLENHHTKTL